MGEQIPMFPKLEEPPLRRSMVGELAAAHRGPRKRQATARRRDGKSRIFCPSCGSRIEIDLAQELAR